MIFHVLSIFRNGMFHDFLILVCALMPDRPRWAWLLDPGGFRVKIHIYPKLMNRYEQIFDEQIWQNWWKDMKNPSNHIKPLNFLIHNSRFWGWPNPGCAIQDPSTKMVQFSQQPRALQKFHLDAPWDDYLQPMMWEFGIHCVIKCHNVS